MRSAFFLFPDGNIQKAVYLGFLCKLLHVFGGDIKEFERALFPEHPHKPCLAVDFLLILQYGIDKQRKVFAAMPDSLRAISVPSRVNRTIWSAGSLP